MTKIFNVKDGNIDAVREYCDLPYIGDIIEKRRINFSNNMLDYKFCACLFAVWLNFTLIIYSAFIL